jgi:hypothetical protein
VRADFGRTAHGQPLDADALAEGDEQVVGELGRDELEDEAADVVGVREGEAGGGQEEDADEGGELSRGCE